MSGTNDNNGQMEYGGLDWFRMAAAILIIAIHTSPLAGINETADFILTRVIARAAVPFFFMVTGFFVLKGGTGSRFRKTGVFLKKTGLLYLGATLLYIPVLIYNGYFKDGSLVGKLLRDLIFEGMFYHLWYLPAVLTGTVILLLLLRFFRERTVLIITAVLYVIGLFGDNYYGLIANVPGVNSVYSVIFTIFGYTRNGLFFAPLFLLLGRMAARRKERMPVRIWAPGLGISSALMLTEGLLIHFFGNARHDSMYVFLPAVMFFLFEGLLAVRGRGQRAFRKISMLVYILHPMCLILVRGAAKVLRLQKLFVDNSLILFLCTVVLSVGMSSALYWLYGWVSRKRLGEV
ncbi:acyltransferase [Anaerolentibacter hominis]|uniref:acyltransferase n=1 Tax=Anaerolentibacter hominis TaxID=3079009 RepID=UPI0031B8975A